MKSSVESRSGHGSLQGFSEEPGHRGRTDEDSKSHSETLLGATPISEDFYSYGHLSVMTGYKWDYTFYKWGYKYL